MESGELILNVSKENKDFLVNFCNETGNDMSKIVDYLISDMKRQYEIRFSLKKMGVDIDE